MWDKFKRACWQSLTIAWAYMQVGISFVGLFGEQLLDAAALMMADPTMFDFIKPYIPGAMMSKVLLVTGIITFAVRMRSILRALKKTGEGHA